MKFLSFGETKATRRVGLNMTFVSQEHSDPVCEYHMEIAQNHIEVSKGLSTRSW